MDEIAIPVERLTHEEVSEGFKSTQWADKKKPPEVKIEQAYEPSGLLQLRSCGLVGDIEYGLVYAEGIGVPVVILKGKMGVSTREKQCVDRAAHGVVQMQVDTNNVQLLCVTCMRYSTQQRQGKIRAEEQRHVQYEKNRSTYRLAEAQTLYSQVPQQVSLENFMKIPKHKAALDNMVRAKFPPLEFIKEAQYSLNDLIPKAVTKKIEEGISPARIQTLALAGRTDHLHIFRKYLYTGLSVIPIGVLQTEASLITRLRERLDSSSAVQCELQTQPIPQMFLKYQKETDTVKREGIKEKIQNKINELAADVLQDVQNALKAVNQEGLQPTTPYHVPASPFVQLIQKAVNQLPLAKAHTTNTTEYTRAVIGKMCGSVVNEIERVTKKLQKEVNRVQLLISAATFIERAHEILDNKELATVAKNNKTAIVNTYSKKGIKSAAQLASMRLETYKVNALQEVLHVLREVHLNERSMAAKEVLGVLKNKVQAMDSAYIQNKTRKNKEALFILRAGTKESDKDYGLINKEKTLSENTSYPTARMRVWLLAARSKLQELRERKLRHLKL